MLEDTRAVRARTPRFRYFLMALRFWLQPWPARPGPGSPIGLLREDHRKISEDGEQKAGDGVGDRESDPGHGALDLHCRLAARAGMRPRPGNAAHQHCWIDLEDVEANRPNDERRDGASDEADQEYLQRHRTGELGQQPGAGIDTDDGDEHDEAEILQHVAGGVRRVAEEPQPRHHRRDDYAG